MNFSPKRSTETEVFSVDYTNLLPEGVTIASAVWSVKTSSGSAAPSMLSGAAVVAGSLVSQMLTGGVPGVTYVPTCAATFSDGQVVILPEPGEGLLQVV